MGFFVMGVPKGDVPFVVPRLFVVTHFVVGAALTDTHVNETEVITEGDYDALVAGGGYYMRLERLEAFAGGIPLAFLLALFVDGFVAGIYFIGENALSGKVATECGDCLTCKGLQDYIDGATGLF